MKKPKYSTDPIMDAALREDAFLQTLQGQDPGATLDQFEEDFPDQPGWMDDDYEPSN